MRAGVISMDISFVISHEDCGSSLVFAVLGVRGSEDTSGKVGNLFHRLEIFFYSLNLVRFHLESSLVAMALMMIALVVIIVSARYSNIAEESVLADDYELEITSLIANVSLSSHFVKETIFP
jgi:hypothetical protein